MASQESTDDAMPAEIPGVKSVSRLRGVLGWGGGVIGGLLVVFATPLAERAGKRLDRTVNCTPAGADPGDCPPGATSSRVAGTTSAAAIAPPIPVVAAAPPPAVVPGSAIAVDIAAETPGDLKSGLAAQLETGLPAAPEGHSVAVAIRIGRPGFAPGNRGQQVMLSWRIAIDGPAQAPCEAPVRYHASRDFGVAALALIGDSVRATIKRGKASCE